MESLESPFSEQFNTNYVPNDAEVQEIRAHLAPHEAELAHLEELLCYLTAKRDQVKDHIDAHKALISYPRHLPQDIVEQIFLACLPAQHNAIMSTSEAPLLLGHICSAWRAIAFSMPRLWSTIHIPFLFVAGKAERKTALVEWLERSAPLPVALSAYGDEDDNDAARGIIFSALQFSARWRALDISKISTDDFFLQLAAVKAPQLVDIQIKFKNDPADEGVQILPSNVFRTSRSVVIGAPFLDTLVPTTPFTWDHLAHLTLTCQYSGGFHWGNEGLTPQAAYRLLKGCTQLRSLEFDFTSSQTEILVAKPLLLPTLESLIIVDSSYTFRHLAYLVEHLVMPRCIRFQVRHIRIPSIPPVSSIGFLKHLAECSPLISDLSLNLSLDSTATTVVETLQMFPHLATLEFVYWDTVLELEHQSPGPSKHVHADLTELFVRLTPTQSAPDPLPALKELRIHGRRLENGILEIFLQKQLEFETNLRQIRIVLSGDPPHPIPDLQPFTARGLSVSVEYIPGPARPPHTAWEGLEQ